MKLNLIGTLQIGKLHRLHTDRRRIGAPVSQTRKRARAGDIAQVLAAQK